MWLKLNFPEVGDLSDTLFHQMNDILIVNNLVHLRTNGEYKIVTVLIDYGFLCHNSGLVPTTPPQRFFDRIWEVAFGIPLPNI
jgi:hypothetical protein